MSTQVLSSTSIDDTNGNVTYLPTGQWTVHTNVESIFHLYQNTDTFTGIQNATATVKFYGNAIEYWGNQGPFHGPCIVSVDGKQMTTVNSYATADDVPILLYSQNNLTLGDHVLEVKVANPSTPNVCEVDRFVANITTGIPSGSATGGSQSTASATGTAGNGTAGNAGGKSSTPVAAIAAGVAGGVALGVFLLGLWLFIRSRRARGPQRLNVSKPLLFGDEPASPQPQTPTFYQPESNRPTSFAPSSVGATSAYNPTLNSGVPPIALSLPPGVPRPQSFAQYNHSSSSLHMQEGPRSSVGPLSLVSSTSTSVPSEPVYPPEKGPGSKMFNTNPRDSVAGPSVVRQPIILTPESANNEAPPPAYDA